MIPISKPYIGAAEKAAVADVLESGNLCQGPRTAIFEERFAQLFGVKHAVAVSSGTAALHVALLANGIGPGDEVITSPFSFVATANAILFTGAKPVFVDVEAETFNLDPVLVEKAITPHTAAILPVHLYGQMCDMDRLQTIAETYGLKIVEDACQAIYANHCGKYAGSYGTGAFSFYATKYLMAGEGGMITTNDDTVADLCHMLRNHGMRQRYHYEMLGYNLRITEVCAAIGLSQLDRLPAFTTQRRANAEFYNATISSVQIPEAKSQHAHVWHQYTVRVNHGQNRDEAIGKLEAAGIGTGVYYPIPLHKQRHIVAAVGEITLPVAERLATEVLSLPVHPQLAQEELSRVVEEVNKL